VSPAARRGKTLDVRVKRIYDPPEPSDGHRLLADRVWPRGVSRERARLDEWAKDLAPSTGLRKWFGHDPQRFDEFRSRYLEELRARDADLERLRALARSGALTILYAARDREHNNAVVLADLVRGF
jgi:uncharacterized protein YeaO (DUF488 family)